MPEEAFLKMVKRVNQRSQNEDPSFTVVDRQVALPSIESAIRLREPNLAYGLFYLNYKGLLRRRSDWTVGFINTKGLLKHTVPALAQASPEDLPLWRKKLTALQPREFTLKDYDKFAVSAMKSRVDNGYVDPNDKLTLFSVDCAPSLSRIYGGIENKLFLLDYNKRRHNKLPYLSRSESRNLMFGSFLESYYQSISKEYESEVAARNYDLLSTILELKESKAKNGVYPEKLEREPRFNYTRLPQGKEANIAIVGTSRSSGFYGEWTLR